MNDHAAIILGVACAWLGGELFVRSAVGIARWARVSPGIIGATVAAFATSSPELTVSITSAVAGHPQISFGDVLGSSVANIALILGLALSISGIKCPRESLRLDFPMALATSLIIALPILDNVVSRFDALVMFCVFLLWFAAIIIEARKGRSNVKEIAKGRGGWQVIVMCAVGLAFLWGAGRLIVAGARGVAISFGIEEFVIGATIVAVGTSVPELATTLIAKLRKHDDVALGTILGSNIFNCLFIIPVAAFITPIAIDWHDAATALAFGVLAVLFIYPTRGGLIGRHRGPMLLALYVIYLFAIVLQRA